MTKFYKFAIIAGSAAVTVAFLVVFAEIKVIPMKTMFVQLDQLAEGYGRPETTTETTTEPTVEPTTEPTVEPTTEPPTDRRRRVLLVTYGRTGSSFTSAIIKLDPQVFHFFEPLHPLNTIHREDFVNRNFTFTLWGPPMFWDSLAWIESFLNCQPKNVTAAHNRLFASRDHTREMCKCMNNESINGWDHLGCYMKMVDDCLSHGVTFIKTVRFRLQWSEHLIQKNPNLKVIYLVRDPRAVLHSQSRVFGSEWFDWKLHLSTVAPEFCRELDSDIQEFRRLSATYPRHFKMIRYEDGAMDPHKFTRDIYTFLGLRYTDLIKANVTEMTTKVENRSIKFSEFENFGTHKDNPVHAMNKWRFSAGYNQSVVVDRHCGHLYKSLGYRGIESEQDLLGNRTFVLDSFQDKE